MYDYKAHTLCDAGTGLPVAVEVTTGSRGDSPALLSLLDSAISAYDWFRPGVCAGGRGYDGRSNCFGLLERSVAQAQRKRELKAGQLRYDIYTGDGAPT